MQTLQVCSYRMNSFLQHDSPILKQNKNAVHLYFFKLYHRIIPLHQCSDSNGQIVPGERFFDELSAFIQHPMAGDNIDGVTGHEFYRR